MPGRSQSEPAGRRVKSGRTARDKILRGFHSDGSIRVLAGVIGQFAVGHFAKKVSWQCTSGISIWHTSHKVDGSQRLMVADGISSALDQYVRCRQCDGCRSFKRAMWTARAITEAEAAASRGRRTWVLTATHRVRLTERADEEFSAEITRALKRLRKLTAFRYLIVFERHKIRPGTVETVGYPHCHGLIHEVGMVLWEDLHMCFSPVGFMKATLLSGDPRKAAGYVGKYMTKNDEPMVCRVRASQGYGDTLEEVPPLHPVEIPPGLHTPHPVATTPQDGEEVLPLGVP